MERAYKIFLILSLVFISFLFLSSKSQCQWANPTYGGYYQPLTYESPGDPYYSYQGYRYYQPQFNWLWTDPFTAYNPYQNQIAFVNPGSAWQYPYFQQTGYNLYGFNMPYNYGGYESSYVSFQPYYGLYSPLGISPSSYNSYGPAFMPGTGWLNPYQIINNPFSLSGFSMYIPDFGLWPPSVGYGLL